MGVKSKETPRKRISGVLLARKIGAGARLALLAVSLLPNYKNTLATKAIVDSV